MVKLKRWGAVWEDKRNHITVVPDSNCLPFFDECELNIVGTTAYIPCKKGNLIYIFTAPYQKKIFLKTPVFIMYKDKVIFSKSNKLTYPVYLILCLVNLLS
jgi:hypothetical protein